MKALFSTQNIEPDVPIDVFSNLMQAHQKVFLIRVYGKNIRIPRLLVWDFRKKNRLWFQLVITNEWKLFNSHHSCRPFLRSSEWTYFPLNNNKFLISLIIIEWKYKYFDIIQSINVPSKYNNELKNWYNHTWMAE